MGPENTFHHLRAFPTPEFREVVRPNFDTLYSIAWLDLTREPMIVSAPDTSGRYYMLPMLDMWSDVFAVPGLRTSGTGAGSFALVSQGWSGKLPDGVQRIDAPTPFVWIIGRTQTNGPADYPAVAKVQDGYRITPLSQWGAPAEPPRHAPDPGIDMTTTPPVQVETMPAGTYFAYAAELMKVNPPHLIDWSMVARLKRIGIQPGQSFDPQAAPPMVQKALERAKADGLARMKAKVPTLAPVVNGWQVSTETMGVYGNAYLKRAVIALIGLGANGCHPPRMAPWASPCACTRPRPRSWMAVGLRRPSAGSNPDRGAARLQLRGPPPLPPCGPRPPGAARFPRHDP